MKLARDIVVVDIETTGLHRGAAVLEVAAVNLNGEEFSFVPNFNPATLIGGEFRAFQINRYFERGIWEQMDASPEMTSENYRYLADILRGNTFAGSNPAFDSTRLPMPETWHHRLLDLSVYAAGKLGIPPNELPGLHAVCERLGVVNEDPHSALGDARATAECFRKLMDGR